MHAAKHYGPNWARKVGPWTKKRICAQLLTNNGNLSHVLQTGKQIQQFRPFVVVFHLGIGWSCLGYFKKKWVGLHSVYQISISWLVIALLPACFFGLNKRVDFKWETATTIVTASSVHWRREDLRVRKRQDTVWNADEASTQNQSSVQVGRSASECSSVGLLVLAPHPKILPVQLVDHDDVSHANSILLNRILVMH